LNLFYEEIEQDILRLLNRVATFVAVDPNNVQMPDEASVFRKVRDQRNMEWAERFAKDLARKGLKLQPSAADWTAQS
jgi:LPS sulfotransferase NodH